MPVLLEPAILIRKVAGMLLGFERDFFSVVDGVDGFATLGSAFGRAPFAFLSHRSIEIVERMELRAYAVYRSTSEIPSVDRVHR